MLGELRAAPDLALDDHSFTLAVAWRSARRYVGRQVSTANDLETRLRQACADTSDLIEAWDYRPYSADSLLEEREFTVVPRTSVAADSSVLDLLRRAAELDHMTPGDLAQRQIGFYAAVLGDDPERRTAYVAKHNPARVGRAGRIISLGHDVLSRTEEPIFLFEPQFDLIIDPESIFVFDGPTFDLLFRDAPEVIAAVGGWVNEIVVDLPFYGNGAATLVARCERDSRLRRRLFAIRERGHLRGLTVTDIVAEVNRLGRDPDRYVRDGALFLDDTDPAALLHLLNEDLFVGGLSRVGFQAQRKAAAP